MLPLPREERSSVKSTPSPFAAFKPEDVRLFHHLSCSMGEYKEVTIVLLGDFCLSVVPSEEEGAGAGFAAPAEGPVGLAMFSQAPQGPLISTSPCR